MNILWICTDQQRFDTLGCYGNKYVKTPNIDRLAAMGTRFNRAYSQSPVCAPSRACFLTGRYPRTCRVRQNGQDIPADERLVTKVLAENGYTCGLSGKLHISACHPDIGRNTEPRIDDGYDYFRWSHHPSGVSPAHGWTMNEYTMWLESRNIQYRSENLAECRYVQSGMEEENHQVTWCMNCAQEYIESARAHGKPWLFSVNVFAPHHPFNPPAEYLERYLKMFDEIPLPNYVPGELDEKPLFQQKDHMGAYDTPGSMAYDAMTEKDHRYVRAAYWAMIDLIDHQVGRLLDYLEESNQLDDTMIIFMSDHGENLGDHGMYLKGPYFYENNIRVPLIIAYPSVIPAGRVSDALVELIDLAPTLCDAAGVDIEPGMQGKSLWPLLTGNAPLDVHRESVYCEYYNANVNHCNPQAFDTMVCNGNYKLVRVHDETGVVKNLGELYDLQNDPNETVNLYHQPEYAQVKSEMLELMCDRMAQTCDPLPVRKAFW
ncbi:MAG TPA: sulfatase-like hydrolase/transferase [Oscillospiraceae bacterium]|nr:sulfatase-like hydrolase/transferase [Oscillospiraceae bacterium]HPF56713.1 sulfatase-like hydrolase/transferase [Clostridiales bacterium]HPK35737.1 sulfatase-like hydrolase/transferase [Oscillospiraceae bacterium]HPR75055.1 sulfatase-like hydrolase/transferase [Oscillospiraceae bacterium]